MAVCECDIIDNTAMDNAFQAILDSLPPKPPRSKLEPYAELIHELRKRGRSYREIAGILATRCGVSAGTHTVYNFVRVRAQAQKKAKAARAGAGRSSQTPAAAVPVETATTQAANQDEEVWQRIQALKQRTPQRNEAEKKVFVFDETKPLQLIPDSKEKK
jgi:IS30 family transposase